MRGYLVWVEDEDEELLKDVLNQLQDEDIVLEYELRESYDD